MVKRLYIGAVVAAALWGCDPIEKTVIIESPDGQVVVTFSLAESSPRYSLSFRGAEIIRDSPRLTRNTILHYSALDNGGFRLRDYTDGHRVEIKEVAGINKTVFLEANYSWTQFEFDADDAATPVTDNDFWTRRIAAMNASHVEMLAASEHTVAAAAG